MGELLKILFCLNFTLILLHEMDAIKNKEWKMFIWLKSMKDNKGYKIFTALHLPLYFLAILALIDKNFYLELSIGLDIFLIFHLIIHFLFRKNRNNEFDNLFSQCIICGMGFISIVHLVIYSFI